MVERRDVLLVDEMYLKLRNIEIHGHEIVGHVSVDWTAVARIEDGALHQRHSDAADHAAGALARGGARIDDAARPIGPERAAVPNGADVGIDCDLGKDSTEGVHRIAVRDLGIALRGGESLDRLAPRSQRRIGAGTHVACRYLDFGDPVLLEAHPRPRRGLFSRIRCGGYPYTDQNPAVAHGARPASGLWVICSA